MRWVDDVEISLTGNGSVVGHVAGDEAQVVMEILSAIHHRHGIGAKFGIDVRRDHAGGNNNHRLFAGVTGSYTGIRFDGHVVAEGSQARVNGAVSGGQVGIPNHEEGGAARVVRGAAGPTPTAADIGACDGRTRGVVNIRAAAFVQSPPGNEATFIGNGPIHVVA